MFDSNWYLERDGGWRLDVFIVRTADRSEVRTKDGEVLHLETGHGLAAAIAFDKCKRWVKQNVRTPFEVRGWRRVENAAEKFIKGSITIEPGRTLARQVWHVRDSGRRVESFKTSKDALCFADSLAEAKPVEPADSPTPT